VSGGLQDLVKMAVTRVLDREARAGRCGPEAAAAPKHPAGFVSPFASGPAMPSAPRASGEAKAASTSPASAPAPAQAPLSATRKGDVAIGSDHGGLELKNDLARYLRECGYRVKDLGTHTADAVDYPDFALAVAAAVARGDAFRGIMVDGVGVGSAMAANKVPGIRAAVCFDVFSTRNAREHNDAHVMCCGGRVLEPAKAREMARVFLETDFGGDRHQKRIDKIVAIERGFLAAAAEKGR